MHGEFFIFLPCPCAGLSLRPSGPQHFRPVSVRPIRAQL